MQVSHHYGNGGGAYNHNYRPPPPPLNRPSYASTGNVAFRFLCHSSRVGGVIGKAGVIVKQLQQETSAKIRVEYPGCNSENRVILVIASAAVNRKIKFSARRDDGEDIAGVEADFEVSAAQEAVIRVFERVLEVTAETGGMVLGNGTLVSCRLIARGNQVGSVIGKGGTVVDAIRKETGCRIKVLTVENLPSCTYPGDKVVEIEGEIMGVKKALIAVTGRLQECMPSERTTFADNEVADVSQESLQVFSTEQNSSMPVNISPRTGGNFFTPRSDSSSDLVSKQEISFKILCPSEKVGCIIGKGGSIVKSLEVETGATIRVGPVIGGCFERLITISAFENLESHQSPARHGVILVFNKLAGIDSEKVSTFGPNGSFISARLVVPANQAGCLLGIGGSIIAEMRKMTGARIAIHKGDHVPACASESDEVVEITGEFSNVQDALCSVTARLRNNLLQVKLTTENSPHGRLRYRHSASATDHINLPSDLTRNMGNLAISNNTNGLRPPSFRPPHLIVNETLSNNSGEGLTSANGGLDIGRSAIVTNTTVEMVVSESAFGSVFGENGINLEHLRQISGAKVLVCRPSGSSDRTIVISGTPVETQTAQNLSFRPS